MSVRFQITSVSLSGSGTHQPHLMGVEKKKRSSAERFKEDHTGAGPALSEKEESNTEMG